MSDIAITGLPVATAAALTDVFPIVQSDNVTRQITNALIFNAPTITSPTLVTPALGTPASGNLSNCTGAPVLTTPNIGIAGGTSLTTTGNQVVSGAGKQGYTTGSGGTIVQASSKSTGVTLNKPTGQITLNNAGLNVINAEKGRDSVMFGIQKMQTEKFYVSSNSTNLIKELRSYIWDTDREGNKLNKPIDAFNHCIDGIRYYFTTKDKYDGYFEVY